MSITGDLFMSKKIKTTLVLTLVILLTVACALESKPIALPKELSIIVEEQPRSTAEPIPQTTQNDETVPEILDEPPIGITHATSINEGYLPSGIAFTDIERVFDELYLENENLIAALSLAVFTSNDLLFEKSYGYTGGTSPEYEIRNNADTVLDWGSVTKTLVWVSAMQLYEQGLLDLNMNISEYLPIDFLPESEYEDPITMLDLMNHTSGLGSAPLTERWNFVFTEEFDFSDYLQTNMPAQISPPGEIFVYSNFGTALGGYVVESISGIPFYEYVQNHIFAPLDMAQTSLKPPDFSDNLFVQEQRGNLISFKQTPGAGTALESLGHIQSVIPDYPAGHAAGTLSDLRKYAQALLPSSDGGTQLFGSAEVIEVMFSTTFEVGVGDYHFKISHGFFNEGMIGLHSPLVGHTGGTDGGSSIMFLDVNNSVGLVIMTNVQNDYFSQVEIPKLIFGN
jgi:CubicO group peptidase (beta-lactamase class C family)